jgi:hypothetical protein
MDTSRLRPVDPSWHDFAASLENYLRLSSLLVDAVELALGEGAVSGNVAGLLRERTSHSSCSVRRGSALNFDRDTLARPSRALLGG